MKTITISGMLLIIAVILGCNNPETKTQNIVEKKSDTIPGKDKGAQMKSLEEEMKEVRFVEISWKDFATNFKGFDTLRKKYSGISAAKTEAVEFEIDPLIIYLNKLKSFNIKHVNVFLGKYVNAAEQPGTGTPIPDDHQNKLTVMFAGKGASSTSTPRTYSYNVGNPWP